MSQNVADVAAVATAQTQVDSPSKPTGFIHHATPIVLNVALIVGTILGARFWDMKSAAGQTKAVYFLSLFVLAAGAAQILMLLPSLRAVGFRFEFKTAFWTPAV